MWAVHPLRVESVAWVTERKDVLAAAFGFLSLWAYVRWTQTGRWTAHAGSAVLLAMSLMAKPVMVVMPALLWALDVWPLGRAGRVPPWRRVWEKGLFVLLAAGGGAITLIAKSDEGAVRGLNAVPLGGRVGNAVVSYARYLWDSVYFGRLAVFYPHPGRWPARDVAAALALFVGITAASAWQRNRRPWLIVGWAWFVVALLPVVGLTQTGDQAMADRFTYVPAVGLLLMVVWSVPSQWSVSGWLASSWVAASVLAGGVVAVLCVFTVIQEGYWKDSYTLFGHALAVTDDNWIAHRTFGVELFNRGRTDEAVGHYRETVRLAPWFAEPHFDLAPLYIRKKDDAAAEAECREAIRLDPAHVRARNELAVLLLDHGRPAEAIRQCELALSTDAGYEPAHVTLARGLLAVGQFAAAEGECDKAVRMRPDDAEAENVWGTVLAEEGRVARRCRISEGRLN